MKGYLITNNGERDIVFNNVNDVFNHLRNKRNYQLKHIIGTPESYLMPERKIVIENAEQTKILKNLETYGQASTGVYYGSFEYRIKTVLIGF